MSLGDFYAFISFRLNLYEIIITQRAEVCQAKYIRRLSLDKIGLLV